MPPPFAGLDGHPLTNLLTAESLLFYRGSAPQVKAFRSDKKKPEPQGSG